MANPQSQTFSRNYVHIYFAGFPYECWSGHKRHNQSNCEHMLTIRVSFSLSPSLSLFLSPPPSSSALFLFPPSPSFSHSPSHLPAVPTTNCEHMLTIRVCVSIIASLIHFLCPPLVRPRAA